MNLEDVAPLSLNRKTSSWRGKVRFLAGYPRANQLALAAAGAAK